MSNSWDKECCYNCIYHDDPKGVCKRYPPQVVRHPKIDEIAYRLPLVKDKDWCGEFKRKKND